MRTFRQGVARAALALAVTALAVTGAVAQTPPGQTGEQKRPAGRGGQRPGMPPGGELNLQTVQNLVDAWALVQAEKDLELSNEQYPDFVARMTRLNNARRRFMMERQRLIRELRASVMTPAENRPEDAALTEKVRSLDDLNQKAAQEVRRLAQEVDGVLTPYQRARFRIFEEQIERQKIDMLIRARAGRGTEPAPAPVAGKARGGG